MPYGNFSGVTGAVPIVFPVAGSSFHARSGRFGISPGLSLAEHITKYDSPYEGFDVLIYTGSGLMGREVENIRSSDIVVIVGGRSGTLGEFAIAYDEGKLIGVLTGTGGMADHIEMMARIIDKDTGGHIIYAAEPSSLLEELLDYYRSAHCGRPSCFG